MCNILPDWPWHQCCPLHCQFVQQFAELWIFPSPEKISLGYIGSLISTNRHNFQTNLCQTRRFGDLWSTSLVNCIVCHISAPTASFRTCKKEPMKVTDDQKNDDHDNEGEWQWWCQGVGWEEMHRLQSHCSKRINLQKPLNCKLHRSKLTVQLSWTVYTPLQEQTMCCNALRQ